MRRFGLDPDRPLVLGTSRLVPRKGFDVLIDAMAHVRPDAQLVIAGAGRDRRRARAPCRRASPGRVRFLGRVPDDALAPLTASADVFAMPCRERWGGLEAEGFGIVFLEAAACGVPAVAGRSGGSHEAVVDGETGLVVEPTAPAVRDALERLLADPDERAAMGAAARARAVAEFSHDQLAARLAPIAAGDLSALGCSREPVPRTRRGGAIVRAGWVANLVFAVTAIPAALGVDSMLDVAIGVALVLFLIACRRVPLRVRRRHRPQRARRQRRGREPVLPAGLRASRRAAHVHRDVRRLPRHRGGDHRERAVRGAGADAAARARRRVGRALREVPAARAGR